MGELMSLIISVIFTVLGGLIAGGIGYLATIVSLRENRKEKHFQDHKNNLKSVSKVLTRLFTEVWIVESEFVTAYDEFKLHKPPFGNEKSISNIEIKKEPVGIYITNPFSKDYGTFQVGINIALYDDIAIHFNALSESLQKTENEVNKNGKMIQKLLNSLAGIIYEKLENSSIVFPYHEENRIVLKKFVDLPNDALKNGYAGSIFLMVIGESECGWPNKVEKLRIDNIYDEMKKLAEEIGNKFGDDLSKLLKLRNNLNQLISDSIEEINRIEITTKLKKNCGCL